MAKDGLRRRGTVWHIDASINGRRIRQSCETEDRNAALTKVRQLVAKLERRGPIVLRADRTTADQAFELVGRDYRLNERRSTWKTLKNIERLDAAFGRWKLATITATDIAAYVDRRKREGAANASANRELSTLKRAFTLAAAAGLISRDDIPVIRLLKEAAPRAGFFAREQFEAMRHHLPEALKPLVTVAYITGWRIKSEILPLRWSQIDFTAETIRLEPGTTKNDDGRTFIMTPELRATLVAQRQVTDAVQRVKGQIVPHVFHREGRPIKNFRRAWVSACQKAGLPRRIPHDFRRTAVRNLERAGVSRSVAMRMIGHRTESIYRRYAIVSEPDLREAALKLAAFERPSSLVEPHARAAGGPARKPKRGDATP